MGTTSEPTAYDLATDTAASHDTARAIEHGDLWHRYAAGDDDARGALLDRHVGLVYYIARQLAAGLADGVTSEDLVGAGTLGLINALEHFEPARGLRFSTYAATRIRGAILDDLRSRDRVPRSVRRKARELNGARTALGAALGRTPTTVETAEQLGIDVATLWDWEAVLEGAQIVSLDEPQGTGSDDDTAIIDRLAPASDDDIEERLTREAEVALLREGIAHLPSRARTVLTLLYFENLTQAEVARTMGMSESGVSHVRARSIDSLRRRLAPIRGLVA